MIKFYHFIFLIMLKFFYESIDTLKEVKVPSKSEVTKMTIAVLVIVIISAVLFAIMDTVLLNVYDKWIYTFLNSIFNK